MRSPRRRVRKLISGGGKMTDSRSSCTMLKDSGSATELFQSKISSIFYALGKLCRL